MDVWLLGAAAIVLIAITLWIVWPSRAVDATPDTVEIAPDEFTSATADLSAGGVATTIAEPEPPTPPAVVAALSTLDMPTVSREPAPVALPLALPPRAEDTRARNVGLGAAAVLVLGGGALLFARWRQRQRKPSKRYRRFIR